MKFDIVNQNKYKWVIWGVLALAYVIVFFHRLAAGVVKEDLMQTFNLSATTFGVIGSLYFYAYMFMQIPSGILADALGAKKTATIGTIVAGVGSIIFGLAPNIVMIFIGRTIVGLGLSVIFISLLKILSEWFEPESFGKMSGITSFIGNMGGILAQSPLALMVAALTWRTSFVIIGAITLLISVLCNLFIINSPKEETFEKEKVVIKGGLMIVLKNKYTWPGFFVFAGLFGAFASMTGTWGRSYMSDVYGLSKITSANYIIIMILGMAIGSVLIGQLSDYLKIKKLPMMIFSGINVASWLVFVYVNLSLPMTGIILFIMGFSTSAFVLSWGCSKEVNPPHITGIATSVVNMGGFFGAAIAPVVMGRILDTYTVITPESYKTAFIVCIVCSVVGLIGTFFVKETNCKNIYSKKAA